MDELVRAGSYDAWRLTRRRGQFPSASPDVAKYDTGWRVERAP